MAYAIRGFVCKTDSDSRAGACCQAGDAGMRDSAVNGRVVVEMGRKLVFASAIDWPGWSRSGRTEEDVIGTLLGYADRYGEVVALAGGDVTLPRHSEVVIVDRQPGDSTTDFGAPAVVHELERAPISGEACEQHLALLRACWRFFEEVGQSVTPGLKKGSRGGGRDRDQIIAHVIEADRTYARKIGVRTPPFDMRDRDAVIAHRDAVFAAIPGLRNGDLVTDRGWPVRYAIRRMAWHILDHAWEMQDKTLSDHT